MIDAQNPLIGQTKQDTIDNVTEGMNELLALLAHNHSGLCRLIGPMVHALEHAARQS